MKYTEKIHAKRLLGMLNKKDPCMCCPGAWHYKVNGFWIIDGCVNGNGICEICFSFIGCKVSRLCPCHKLGEKKAIKRTWLALEEKGYI